MNPDVTVIVPVLDQAAALEDCLRSLSELDIDRSRLEVIVVDNGSRDDSRAVARSFPVRCLVESRRSSYAARNLGARAARGTTLAFVDADCVADTAWVRRGLAIFEETGADLVGGRVEILSSALPNLFEIYDRLKYLDQKRSLEKMGYAATANLLVRKRVFDELGGFDGSLLSGGDREFCMRARERGYRIAYGENVTVRHAARASLRSILAKNERIGYGTVQIVRRRPSELRRVFPMLLFFVPRRKFLLDAVRATAPCTRACLVRLFLLDWLAKQYLFAGCVRGALREWSHHGSRSAATAKIPR